MDLDAPNDPVALLERGRALWDVARDRCARDRIDLFIKSAVRRRVLRDHAGSALPLMESLETGIALRVAQPRAAIASFAACSGITFGSIDWALRTARSLPPTVDGTMPGAATIDLPQRDDVDAPGPLPEAGQLEAWLPGDGPARWIECGTTTEVLIGDGGWATVRQRHRTWAMLGEHHPRLIARRGFEAPLDEPAIFLDELGLPGSIALTASAAASLVGAVAGSVHSRIESIGWFVGPAWMLMDDPLNARGLAGGTFDDVGFPTAVRQLADGSSCRAWLSGPGTYRRRSYREPPIPLASNLVISAPCAPAPPQGSRVVSRCRILPLSGDDWRVEMGGSVSSEPPSYLRTTPSQLLQGFAVAWGTPWMSAEGVLTPGLVLVGLGPVG